MTERNETIAPETDKRAARRDSRLFEFIIGAGVLLISLISLFVAVSANRTQERMLAASVWPSLMFGTSSVSPEGVPEIRLDLDHPVAHAATGSVDACMGGAERRAPQGPVACLLLLGTRRLLAVRQRPRRPRIGAAMPAKAGGPLGRLSGNERPTASRCGRSISSVRCRLQPADGYVAWVGDLTQLGLADALTTWFGPPH